MTKIWTEMTKIWKLLNVRHYRNIENYNVIKNDKNDKEMINDEIVICQNDKYEI